MSLAPDTARDNARTTRMFRSLSRLQARFPLLFVAFALLLTCIGGVLATRLSLMLRFEQLLPETRPSVVELARLSANVRAGSHAFVLVEGGDTAMQRAFGDALVERIRVRAPRWLSDVNDGVQDGRRFLRPRAGMFISLADLRQLHDDVEARWSWEVAKQTDTNLDDEPPPDLSWEKLKQRLGLPSVEQYPDGYFQDASALVVAVSTSIEAGDLPAMQAALSVIETEARGLEQKQFAALRLSFAGDLVTGLAEYGAVTHDLMGVGLLGIGLVLGVLFLYFRRWRALFALSATLLLGLAATFGLTEIFIGHLNVATGFLVSIVAGGGINFGIIYLARFFEERRRGVAPEQALVTAHTGTWLGTSTAALAAAAAYGSLGISEFRAFRDFALIGSMGMIACWLASYFLLPALLILCERVRPFSRPDVASVARAGRSPSSQSWMPSVALARWLALGGVGLAIVGVATLVPYVRRDPMEYDMRQMQNNLGGSDEMYRASRIAGQIVGAKLDGAMLLLAERPDQVPALKRILEARRDRAPVGQKPFEAVHTAFDFVPEQQAEKLPLLRQIAQRVHKAHARGFVSEADFRQLQAFLPPDDLAPWQVLDLPSVLSRPFTDRAGVVGRLALIEPAAGQSDADVKYLMRWADSFRSVRLPSGESIRGSGRAVIFADILSTVLHDIPRTVALAFFATVASVLIAFRRGWHAAFVLASLLVGLGWVALGMTLLQLKINFFNFVALPVSFGIGVDYSVNLMQRYAAEPEHGVIAALRRSGGAVVLCSLTTTLGYLALLASVNQAIRSLGVLAVLGEIGCLVAATLVLPAWLYLRERRDRGQLLRQIDGGERQVSADQVQSELLRGAVAGDVQGLRAQRD